MAVVSFPLSRAQALAPDFGEAGTVKNAGRSITTNADDSINSTYDFCKIPVDAILLPSSRIHTDDLASSGSPSFDFGFFGDQITDDDDALRANVGVSSANTDLYAISDKSNWYKKVWEILGLSSSPGGTITVRGTLKAAAINTAGEVCVDLYYKLD